MTVSGFDSRVVTLFRYVTSHPGRLSLLLSASRSNECQSKVGDALRLGSKGRHGLFAGKTACVLPYLITLENAFGV